MKKLPILYITQGLPASGKSTWARDLADKSQGQIKLVSKDELRAMLDHGNWSKKNEKFVMDIRDNIILEAVSQGYSIVCHDTNFGGHVDHLTGLTQGKATVQVVSFTHVPLEECLKRDQKRANYVGEKVIRDMYKKYLAPYQPSAESRKPAYVPGKPDVIICDLDGTLALFMGKRSPYDASKCADDDLNEAVASVIRGQDVVFVSGRSEDFYAQTVQFLTRHGFENYPLFMRHSLDTRNDAIVKREIYETCIRGNYNVRFVLDDRNRVVETWRDLGLTCFQVAPGDF